MKRSELLALAERLDHFALGSGDIGTAAAILRQIAEAEPVAVRHDFDGHGWLYFDNGSGSDWMTRHENAEPLYTLPMED